MAISAAQKKALEAAGYTVKGNGVYNKSGQVAGEGWSGSSKVSDILKAKPKAEAAPTAKKAAPATKDAMKGYRKGDVTTSPLPEDTVAKTRQALAATARGTVDEKMRTRQPSAGAMMKVSAKASGGVSPAASQKKDVRTGKPAAQAPVFMKKTGTAAQDSLAQKWAAAEKNMPAGLNFNDWKSKFGGKQWKPGEALDAYAKYKAKSGMAKGGMTKKKGC